MVKPFELPVLSDKRIVELLKEVKPVPTDWQTRLIPGRSRMGHRRGSLAIVGRQGSHFVASTRQSNGYPDNFSVVLEYRSSDGFSYRLLRCNGLHPGGHRNHIERSSFGTSFHLHRATARYQERGLQIDGFAEQTGEYSSLSQAVRYLGRVAAFELETGQQEMNI